MSGSLKLKIKLKPRPQETEFASGRSDHKRKLEDYSPQHSGFQSLGANGNHNEVQRPKKQKQHQQAAGQLQPTASGKKVKLHIKGPWSKAATALETKDSPLRHSSLGHAQQSHSQGKPSSHGPSVTLKQRPPAKAVQAPGQADAAAPDRNPSKKQKVKGFAKVKQQPSDALDIQSRGGAASRDTASQNANFEARSGQAEASIAQVPKPEGTVALAVPTRAILERIVDKMQRKDTFNIFRDPQRLWYVLLPCSLPNLQ